VVRFRVSVRCWKNVWAWWTRAQRAYSLMRARIVDMLSRGRPRAFQIRAVVQERGVCGRAWMRSPRRRLPLWGLPDRDRSASPARPSVWWRAIQARTVSGRSAAGRRSRPADIPPGGHPARRTSRPADIPPGGHPARRTSRPADIPPGGQDDHHDPGGVAPGSVQGGKQFGVLLLGHAGEDVRGTHTDGDLVVWLVCCGSWIRQDFVLILDTGQVCERLLSPPARTVHRAANCGGATRG